MAIYTLADFQKFVQHAIGHPVDTAFGSSLQLVNDSLDEIAYAHPWSWRQRKFSLAVTGGSNNVASLPADFAGIHVAHIGTAGNAAGVQYREEILPLRAGQSQKNKGTFRYILDATPQANATSQPTQAMYIYPAPSATTVVEGIYLRSIAHMSGGTDVPDFPRHFNMLLKTAVRARAMLEDGAPGAADEMKLKNELLAALIAQDDANTSNEDATNPSK
jgi:hypothetical protein